MSFYEYPFLDQVGLMSVASAPLAAVALFIASQIRGDADGCALLGSGGAVAAVRTG